MSCVGYIHNQALKNLLQSQERHKLAKDHKFVQSLLSKTKVYICRSNKQFCVIHAEMHMK